MNSNTTNFVEKLNYWKKKIFNRRNSNFIHEMLIKCNKKISESNYFNE